MKKCHHCDFENKKGTKFCDNCGRPVHEEGGPAFMYEQEPDSINMQQDPVGKW